MKPERSKQLVEAFVQAINERNWERLDELLAPNFTRHSSSAPAVTSRWELKEYLQREVEVFPDAVESIEDCLAEKDKVAVRHRFRGTQRGWMGPYPPSGNTLVADYIAIYRIAEGVLAESWVEWDNLNGLLQLGHYKPAA